MGFTGEQLGKPIIAIANSYTNATPGHFVLKQLCESVKEGIIKAGGTPMEFSTVAPVPCWELLIPVSYTHLDCKGEENIRASPG